MSASLVVGTVIGVFFVAGLIVGAITVIALPILRGTRGGRNKRREPDGRTGQQGNNDQMSDAHVRR